MFTLKEEGCRLGLSPTTKREMGGWVSPRLLLSGSLFPPPLTHAVKQKQINGTICPTNHISGSASGGEKNFSLSIFFPSRSELPIFQGDICSNKMYSCLTFIKVCRGGGGGIMTGGDREMASSFPTNVFKGGLWRCPLHTGLCVKEMGLELAHSLEKYDSGVRYKSLNTPSFVSKFKTCSTKKK